jgi:hypothetical protein
MEDEETKRQKEVLTNMNDRDWNNGQLWNKIITMSKREQEDISVKKW